VKALALLLVAHTAYADDVGFATLDRQDGESKLTAALSYFSHGNAGQLARLDLAGQFIKPSIGGGFYFAVPIAYQSDPDAQTTTSLGGIELGGIYHSRTDITLHGGFVLPTADVMGQALLQSTIARIGDLAQALPNAAVLRLGIAYNFRACQTFGRIELGIDAPLSVEDNGAFAGNILRLDAAIGIDADAFTLAVETVNVFGFNGPTFDDVAATLRIRAGTARPFISAIIPLDDQANEPTLVIMVGLELAVGGSR
jgi:hypothetical protein